MNWITKLERKYGRFCIPNLINILIGGQILVYAIELFVNQYISFYLSLSRSALFAGQIWRLFTFVLVPFSGGGPLSVVLGILSWAIMAFFGMEFAVFWGVLIALLNYVPYIGSFLSVFLPAVFAILQFGNLNSVLAVMVPLSIVQFANGNFLDPYLMGNSLNLSPFVILVSLTVWSALWGIPGAFLAVPMTAVMVMIFAEFPGTRPFAVLLSRKGDV